MIISYSRHNHQFNMAKFAIACVLFSLVAAALAHGRYGMGQTSHNGNSNGGYNGNSGGSYYGKSVYPSDPYSNGGYMKAGPNSGGYKSSSRSRSYGDSNGYSSPIYGLGSSASNAY